MMSKSGEIKTHRPNSTGQQFTLTHYHEGAYKKIALYRIIIAEFA
jgi:hypothetical protein